MVRRQCLARPYKFQVMDVALVVVLGSDGDEGSVEALALALAGDEAMEEALVGVELIP